MKKKKNFWSFFQNLGKSFMYPIALLSVCGMFLGIGSGLTDPGVIENIPFLGYKFVNLTLQFLVQIGLFGFSFLPVMFAMAIPIGMLKDKEAKAYGALSAFVGFAAMHIGTSFYLAQTGQLVDPSIMNVSGQTMVLGIQSYNTSVLGGIIIGLIVYGLYDKVVNLKIPQSLGFYSGPRLVPIVTLIVCSVFGLLMPFVWPPFFNFFIKMGEWISKAGPLGYFSYAAAERVTIPFGLNHLVTSIFRFTPVGGTAIINGVEYQGTLNMFMAYVADNQVIPLDLAGKMEQGKLMIQYGLAGAALAMYHCADLKKRKSIRGLLISGVLTVIIGGVSEPLEFLFLFVSPALYGFHAVMNGLAGMILPYLGVLMGYTGDLIQFLSFGVLRGERTGWPMAIVVMIIYFFIYYFVFKWAIKKFNIMTPGREVDEDEDIEEFTINNTLGKNTGSDMIAALGGKDNIVSLENCVTRLRLTVKDMNAINEANIKKAGGVAVVKLDATTLQIIIGTNVYSVRKEMDQVMGLHA